MARRRQDPNEKALLRELEAIYAAADEAFAAYRCQGATECCRFAITGREPYVTSIELLGVERAVAARGGPLKGRGRALPLAPGDTPATERTCPLLAHQGRCSIYRWRPLGCRTFWCHRAVTEREVPHPELLALVRRVQELAVRHAVDGDRGRPLTRALPPSRD